MDHEAPHPEPDLRWVGLLVVLLSAGLMVMAIWWVLGW